MARRTVRQVESALSAVEDRILAGLGYREYSVRVGAVPLIILPGIEQKNISSYSDSQQRGFADALGGQGNPISIFKLKVSREVPEALVRSYDYWTLERDGYSATCLPVEIKVTDSRYEIMLGVIKQNG